MALEGACSRNDGDPDAGGKAWSRVLSKETCVPRKERFLCISRVPGPDLAGLQPWFLTASLLRKPHGGFSFAWCFGTSVTKTEAAWLPGPSHARAVSFPGVTEPLPRSRGPVLPSDTPPCPLPSHPELPSRPPASSSDAKRLRFCCPSRSLLCRIKAQSWVFTTSCPPPAPVSRLTLTASHLTMARDPPRPGCRLR